MIFMANMPFMVLIISIACVQGIDQPITDIQLHEIANLLVVAINVILTKAFGKLRSYPGNIVKPPKFCVPLCFAPCEQSHPNGAHDVTEHGDDQFHLLTA